MSHAPRAAHIYLIPGFFGFTNFGDLRYFAHVTEALTERLEARGVAPLIHHVRTLPTACIRDRAQRLRDVVRATAAADPHPIHLIGHSSGGLDARLFLSPGVDLGGEEGEVERLASRVESLTTISTPHRGTPLASFFMGVQGQRLLRLLSLATVIVVRHGRVPLGLFLRLVDMFRRVLSGVRIEARVFEQFYSQLLQDFCAERQEDVSTFFDDVGRDQALMAQLTLDGARLFNATVRDRPGVRVGSVVTQARPPRLMGIRELGLDAYGQAAYALYRWLHRRVGADSRSLAARLDQAGREALRLGFGEFPFGGGRGANDAIVPTASQPHGRVIHCAWADHLDVVGHFFDPAHVPAHYDWIPTGSRFDRSCFDRLWDAVTDHLLSDEGQGK